LIGVSEMLLRDEKDIYVGDFAGGKKRVPVADAAPRLLLHVVRDTGSYHAPCRQPPPKEVFNLAVVCSFLIQLCSSAWALEEGGYPGAMKAKMGDR